MIRAITLAAGVAFTPLLHAIDSAGSGVEICPYGNSLWTDWTIPGGYAYTCIAEQSADLQRGVVEMGGELFVRAPVIRLRDVRIEAGARAILRAE